MKAVVSEVLEEMFYLVPDELEGESNPGEGQYLAEITLNGPRRLTVQLLFSQGLAEEMASNFLPDGDIDPSLVRDVLRETANMVGGNLASLLDGDWDLSLPEVYEGVEAQGAVLGREPMGELDVEGEPLYLYVEVE